MKQPDNLITHVKDGVSLRGYIVKAITWRNPTQKAALKKPQTRVIIVPGRPDKDMVAALGLRSYASPSLTVLAGKCRLDNVNGATHIISDIGSGSSRALPSEALVLTATVTARYGAPTNSERALIAGRSLAEKMFG